MKIVILLVVIIAFSQLSFSQGFPKKEIMKKYGFDMLDMDKGNEDGVFKARAYKAKKWGMYQWMYEGTMIQTLIPAQYDSLKYFPLNGNFTAVYNNGKVGFYLSKWSYDSKAKQSVACKYDDYKRFNVKGYTYLVVESDGKWGWVDWLTGEEKSAFVYTTAKEVPSPQFKQETWFED